MPRNHIAGSVCAWLLASNRISVVVRMGESKPDAPRRCWTRSEALHGKKNENGSFASDLRSVHISRYQTKLVLTQIEYAVYFSVSEIVWT